ncbi:hypothetical protein PV08_03617 [Exophiala spinifera]|uniref:Uncharacterized protein n=1 Tax=Exophiala spinifera TaxID=91928 RepID=A0A0D2BK79_9EURO|nr:uncharacterized protein PV08_03617 [Exophiala spinifera]KIW19323.1 hypothetical protein PV08_03617 [Exophiala spinifera]
MAVPFSIQPYIQEISVNTSSESLSDTYSDDEESAVSADEDDNPQQQDDDRRRPQNNTIEIRVSREYTPNWGPEHAFRELYQNWKDGILSSFKLDVNLFKPIIKESKLSINITVHAPQPTPGTSRRNQGSQLLGFITFKKKSGQLIMSNFQAMLERHHLILGHSTKRNDRKLAGFHGEGFKLAALIMVRDGYGMKYESNSQHWRFKLQFEDGIEILQCTLKHAPEKTLCRQKERFANSKRSSSLRPRLSSNIWEDTTVKVGALSQNNCGITCEDFRGWLTVTLDLQEFKENDIIHVQTGDLILSNAHKGALYLNGLKLEENRSGSTDYQFGYNFHKGKINRDREKMMYRDQEAQMVAAIWEEAMCLDAWEHTVIEHYFKLFQNYENPSDTFLAYKTVSRLAMVKMWKHLRVQFPDSFFFSDEDNTRSHLDAIIEKDLGKRPYKLKNVLWKLLKKYSLVRTPHEERVFLFFHSPPALIQCHAFSIQLERALRCALKSSGALENVKIQFVKGESLSIDVLFQNDNNLLRIHDKWLEYSKVHQNRQCSLFEAKNGKLSSEDIFLCDHAVNDLIEMFLRELHGPLKLDHEEYQAIRSRSATKLQEMPRDVHVSSTRNRDELLVSWAGAQSRAFLDKYGEFVNYSVTLHKMSTCETKKDALLYTGGAGQDSPAGTTQMVAPCGCPLQITTGDNFQTLFRGLDSSESYFAMVCRDDDRAFYAWPRVPVKPAEASLTSANPAMPNSGGTNSERNLEMDMCDISITEPIDSWTDLSSESPSTSPPTTQASNSKSASEQQARVSRRSIDPRPCPVDASSMPHPWRNGSTPPVNQDSSSNTSGGEQQVVTRRPRDRSPIRVDDTGMAQEQDRRAWDLWTSEKLPVLYNSFIPGRTATTLNGTSLSGLECEHLDHTFERGETVLVHLNHGSDRHVIQIHHICQHEADDGSSFCLKSTKYSFLEDIGAFKTMADGQLINSKELVLHFDDYDQMGTPIDAEMIDVEDIISVDKCEGIEVKLIGPSSIDEDNSVFFCRFAIRSSQGQDGAYLAPLAPRLIGWKGRKFADKSSPPLVFDLSPNVLGASEGFSQANFSIRAAFGFDKARDVTWKLRHPHGEAFDGTCAEIIDDIQMSRLEGIGIPEPTPAKVALVSNESAYFRLSCENNSMPTIQEFLEPLKGIASVAQALDPDFYAMLLSPAVLQEEQLGEQGRARQERSLISASRVSDFLNRGTGMGRYNKPDRSDDNDRGTRLVANLGIQGLLVQSVSDMSGSTLHGWVAGEKAEY